MISLAILIFFIGRTGFFDTRFPDQECSFSGSNENLNDYNQTEYERPPKMEVPTRTIVAPS